MPYTQKFKLKCEICLNVNKRYYIPTNKTDQIDFYYISVLYFAVCLKQILGLCNLRISKNRFDFYVSKKE